MTKTLSKLISWGCLTLLLVTPLIAVYYAFDIQAFAVLSQSILSMAIQWQTVTDAQWYALWALTFGYLAVGLTGLYNLRKAFVNFAKGELFNTTNSRYLRLFSLFLLLQAILKPIHLAAVSVLLSWYHPPGQKMFTLVLGSAELKMLALAIIFWVLSDLLVKASALDAENKQFI